MTLGELIKALEGMKPDTVVKYGFNGKTAHSYRGDYSDLAFERDDYATVKSMLEGAKAALGKTFSGYKGGVYEMHEYVDVHFAERGDCENSETNPLLAYWRADEYYGV